jgi:hypothetical protein
VRKAEQHQRERGAERAGRDQPMRGPRSGDSFVDGKQPQQAFTSCPQSLKADVSSIRQPHRFPLSAHPRKIERIRSRDRGLISEQEHVRSAATRDPIERG